MSCRLTLHILHTLSLFVCGASATSGPKWESKSIGKTQFVNSQPPTSVPLSRPTRPPFPPDHFRAEQSIKRATFGPGDFGSPKATLSVPPIRASLRRKSGEWVRGWRGSRREAQAHFVNLKLLPAPRTHSHTHFSGAKLVQ